MVTLFLAAFAAPSTAAVPNPPGIVPDPPSGVSWTWHTTSMPAPNTDCVIKLGYATANGYLYTKQVTNCNDSKFFFRLELYVSRNGNDVINGAIKDCWPSGSASYWQCTAIKGVPNPAGSQEWYINSLHSVNDVGNIAWAPRWHIYV